VQIHVGSAADSQALKGATVKISGMNNPLYTDETGNVTLRFLVGDSVAISYTGYRTRIFGLKIPSTGKINILLEPLNNQLEEVMVSTGYQSIPKERATGSFASVSEKLFNEQVGTSVIDRLPNVVGSMTVDRRTSTAGNIAIRGLSTIQGPKSPLIILNNFPYMGDLNNLNPNDVESVTVLKDAAATSIWGAKAGNGVIVITTKKGKLNQALTVTLNSNLTIGEEPDLFKIKQINTSDFIDVEQFLYSNGRYASNTPATDRLPVSPVVALLRRVERGLMSLPSASAMIDAFRGNDIREEYAKYFYRPSINSQHSLSLSNGNERTSWRLNVGLDQNRSELSAKFQRATVNLSNMAKIGRSLELNTNVVYTNSNAKNGRPAYGTIVRAGGDVSPYIQFADAQGNALPMAKNHSFDYLETLPPGKLLDWKYYPLTDYHHSNSERKLFEVLLDARLRYKIFSSLSVDVLYRYNFQQITTDLLNDENSYSTRDMINNFTQVSANGLVSRKIPIGGILDKSTNDRPSQNLRGQLNYNKKWKNSALDIILGQEFSEDSSLGKRERTYGFNSDVLTFSYVDYITQFPQYVSGGTALIAKGNGITESTNRYVSSFFNLGYTLKERYTVSLSARRDGSNLFGVLPNNRFNPLASIGASWVLSREGFFDVAFVDHLKIRSTFGYSGNTDQNRTAYSTLEYPENSIYTNSPYAEISGYANPELKWEKIAMLNLGVDFSLFKSRVSGSIEYYTKRATDLFGRAQLDLTGGAGSTIVKNVAEMRAHGLDIEVNSINTEGVVKWTTSINISQNRDKIVNYNTLPTMGTDFVGKATPQLNAVVGRPVYSMYSYAFGGLNSMNGNPIGYLNGAATEDYARIVGTGTKLEDLVYHGSALPTTFGNLRNNFTYKNLSLSIALNFKFGYYYRRASINYNTLFSTGAGHPDYEFRWRKPGDEAYTSIPSMTYPANGQRDAFFNGSEATIIKGDHIRLQYVNLEYSFLRSKLKKLPFESLSIYVNAANLGLLWRANKQGIDPEFLESAIPPTKSFTGGIRVNF